MSDYGLVDVFIEGTEGGNAAGVYPDAADMPAEEMQAHAAELNLSETTFVTRCDDSSYDVRIFTPREEIPFAGHPTLGTTWILLDMGRLKGDRFIQNSAAGPTEVRRGGDVLWFSRTGAASHDLDRTEPRIVESIADALGLEPRDVGLEARELGRSGFLRPAYSNAGLKHLCVPLRDVATLGRVKVDETRLAALSHEGAYCFTAERAGEVRARGFFPEYGIAEDPATGSGAAALGVYLVARLGDVAFDVRQGVEMGAPSRLLVKARSGEVDVGGRCNITSR